MRTSDQSRMLPVKLDRTRLLGFDQAPAGALRGELTGALAGKVGAKPQAG